MVEKLSRRKLLERVVGSLVGGGLLGSPVVFALAVRRRAEHLRAMSEKSRYRIRVSEDIRTPDFV